MHSVWGLTRYSVPLAATSVNYGIPLKPPETIGTWHIYAFSGSAVCKRHLCLWLSPVTAPGQEDDRSAGDWQDQDKHQDNGDQDSSTDDGNAHAERL